MADDRAPKKFRKTEGDNVYLTNEKARIRLLVPKCDGGFTVREAEPMQNDNQIFEILSLYNRKGGVGKTTISLTLAWMAAQRGNRVMLVDADPQCDITTLLMTKHIKETFEGGVAEHLRTGDLNLFYENGEAAEPPRINNMFAGIKPVTLPSGGDNEDVTAVDLMEIRAKSLNINGGALFLAPGHYDLEEYGMNVASAVKSSLGNDPNAPGAWHYCLRQSAQKYSINFVLQDCNPSAGALSFITVMSSDYLICPCSPDLLSLNAIKHMHIQYDRWCKMATACVGAQDANDVQDQYKLRTAPNGGTRVPVWLGITMMRYIPTGTTSDGSMIAADKLGRFVEEIVRELKRKTQILRDGVRTGRMISQDAAKQPAFLLDMGEFFSLNPLSQYHGVPVVALGGATLRMPRTTNANNHDASVDKHTMGFWRFLVKLLKRQNGQVVQHVGIVLNTEADIDLDPFAVAVQAP
eukprot:CAMPEP_0173393318 /NCGR_PEP_ID=MMETSP1356-20130122/22041_1 /TAXON_ID=77927 ORGANISM="Hemiselmis virescens, Strain PCC157" /NCGR_SAMPLE_ID=MMETSP1356 /ASSEMBLY_ACC=CAM_ASM_000847 /LENGTH=464 /DNA_ID=CAMNT_0014351323 /DNA_START=85 /DNA_END=1479 /DNA_ORIENTATION=-